MKKFRTLAEAHEAFDLQSSELAALQASNEELNAQVTALTTERDQAQQATQIALNEKAEVNAQLDAALAVGAELREQLNGKETEVASLTEGLGQTKSDLEKAQANVDRISQLARVRGIDPEQAVAVHGGEGQPTGENLLEQLGKLQGRERTEFFRSHKEALMKLA